MSFSQKSYSFTSGTTISASQVNTNFDDIFNGVSDGTKDVSVNNATFAGGIDANGVMSVAGALTASSTARFSGAVTASAAVYAMSTLQCTGALTASSTASFAGAVYNEGGMRTTGAASFVNAVTFDGKVYANDDICANTTNNPYVTTAVISGFTGTINSRYISFFARGKERKCHFLIDASSGVSNAASMVLPTSIASTINNGTLAVPINCGDATTSIVGMAYINGTNVTFYNSPATSGNNWTSGTSRSVRGTLCYEVD
jgi:hypothetical protein